MIILCKYHRQTDGQTDRQTTQKYSSEPHKMRDYFNSGIKTKIKKLVELLIKLQLVSTSLMRVKLSIKHKKLDFFISFTF